MRVRIKDETGLPAVYEAKSVRPVWDDKIFTIEFTLVEKDGRKEFILASILKEDDMTDILNKYESIVTSLGLNGYVNLFIGETTCALGISEDWDVQFA